MGDGDRHCHCDLGIPRCDGSIFFSSLVCAEMLFPPYISSQMPYFSKTLQSLLMRLVIFVTTVLQLNLRVCSKLNKSITKHLVPSGTSWSLKQAEEVCVDLHDHGNHKIP